MTSLRRRDEDIDQENGILLDANAIAGLIELVAPVCLIIVIILTGLLGYGWYAGTKLMEHVNRLEKRVDILQVLVEKKIEQPIILFSDRISDSNITGSSTQIDFASMPIIVLPQPEKKDKKSGS